MVEETDLEKCNFGNFRSPVTLTLTVDRVIRHTVMHHSSTSIYAPNFIEIRKKLFVYGWTDRCTDLLMDISDPSNVIRSTSRSRHNNEKN